MKMATPRINDLNARSRRRPSVDSALTIQQAHYASQKNHRSKMVLGGKVAQLLLTSRRPSFSETSSVLPDPEPADPAKRTAKVGRPWSRLPSNESVDSNGDWSQKALQEGIASDANWQPNWSRRPSVDSATSSVTSNNSHSIWSRRPSVDSVASTVDSTVDSVPQHAQLGFNSVGVVAAAAQKLKRLSQESIDYTRNAQDMRGECSHCFANLCERSIVFLNDKSKPDSQNCRHFLHAGCCSAIKRRARKEGKHPECPKCKCEFGDVVSMPHPLEDPDGWYHALDVHSSDRVPREIVLEALVASLPIEAMSIKGMIWRKGAVRGKLTLKECKEVLSKVEHDLPKIQRTQSPPGPPPNIEKAEEWFAHWDVGGAGFLTQEEATRAMLKSFPNHDLPLLREAIDLAWQENAQLNPDFADTIGPEAFANQKTGIVSLVLKKYQAAKYWKIWGSDDSDMENRIPRCLSCISEAAF
eukprot:gnl/MRDRNA2_/MRDRNA2_88066_c0_seq1.p1 gnl/MRDRNA2_/MRDRNA2_88066_c0~~gnl/MRDRNA2_/MRDRNA2_88066_c0_seq1.p1  ORF type:complete len:470 (+),score=74.61 gnl/MRDRNA2_/MRDRNA2_88066_c0_seq1:92-1501(+)